MRQESRQERRQESRREGGDANGRVTSGLERTFQSVNHTPLPPTHNAGMPPPAGPIIRSGAARETCASDDEAFEALYRTCGPRVFAYVRRHVPPADCDDVVAEVFIVAWRRRLTVPPDPLPWLIVVARNVLRGRRRLATRADKVWWEAVRALAAPAYSASPEASIDEREALLEGLARCSRAEREALLLVAWDGLTAAQAADVAGCSTRAFTVRLSRARARLNGALVDRPDRSATPLLLTPSTPLTQEH